MEPIDTIEQILSKLSQRQRVLNGVRTGSFVFFWASLAVLILLAIQKLTPLPDVLSPRWIVAGAGIAVLCGMARGIWRKPSLLNTARWVDDTMRLQERLSTAWEYRQSAAHGDWHRLVTDDATRVVKTIEPHRLLPWRCPKSAVWGFVLCLMMVALGFVPEYRTTAAIKQAEDAKLLADTGKQLAELTKQQLEQRHPVLQPTEKALNEVAEFGEKLSQVNATRNEALKDLANLQQKLEKQFQDLAEKPAVRNLEKSAREPSTGSNPNDLQQRMDALKQALGKAAGKEDAIDQLKRKLGQIKQKAEALPTGDSDDAKSAREKLEESLNDLAQQAKDAGIPMASLDEAIDALRKSQTDFFVRDLNTALNDLEKLQELGKNLQQLQQEMSRVAKDLAEQLKLGQAKAAQSTMKRMIDHLRSNSTTPEQLQKVLEEVQNALGPAKEYGEVSSHLRGAAEKLSQAQASGQQSKAEPGLRDAAATDLARAAAELDKLAQQAADAEDLAAAIESLSRAQMSLSTGKQFGQCRGDRPGFGKGGKPGKGVGTWAEDEGWTQIPEQNQGWDNSGITRPDLESKGLTDRGEGEHNPALTPTKVRGQLSPGGSMQSITLKGVHIRGQSQVQFTEAAAAAQAEAQNALNQDQVPRAYQQSVRDYFDDFKK